MRSRIVCGIVLLAAGFAGWTHFSIAGEYLNGIEWTPPPIIQPGMSNSDPPSDATVLFDGTDLSNFSGAEKWSMDDGDMIAGSGTVTTKQEFGDCQVHIEWSAPTPAKGDGQGRGNSGLFLMGRYELQILDSYDNPTYHDGQAGAIYKQTPPMVNVTRPPGEWNTYDVFWTSPVFNDDGSLDSPAFITAVHNGVLILNHFALLGDTPYTRPPQYNAHGPTGPISIQDHSNPVRFRNIWVREIKPAVGKPVREPFIREGDQEIPVKKKVSGGATESASSEILPVGKVTQLEAAFEFTEGPTATPDGGYYFTDIPNNAIHYVNADNHVSLFSDDSHHSNGLWFVAPDKLYACEMDGQVVCWNTMTRQRTMLADSYNDTRFNAPNDLVVDSAGGIYFTDPLYRSPEPLPQKVQAVYYIAPDGTVSRVTGGIDAPNGIGMSPDGRKLYVAPTNSGQMLVYEILSAGKLSGGEVFCQITQPDGKSGTGSDGITVDDAGNVYFTTERGVEVVSPSGESLSIIELPQQPANVTFAGRDKTTLIATARSAVYVVPMPNRGL